MPSTSTAEAARLFPDDYATQFNLALAVQRSGDAQAAIPEFEKAIRLAPAEASFHLALGNSLQAAGRLPEARKAFETYLEMEPSAPDAAKVKAHIEVLSAAISTKSARHPARSRRRPPFGDPPALEWLSNRYFFWIAMRLHIPALLTIVAIGLGRAPVAGQTLADVAKKEEERRKTVKPAGQDVHEQGPRHAATRHAVSSAGQASRLD